MLLLPVRPNIPIHVMMATVLIRWMLVMSMLLLLLVLGIVVVVEVIEGRRWIFCEAGLLLVGVMVSSGEVLLGGDWRELGGVVVGGC